MVPTLLCIVNAGNFPLTNLVLNRLSQNFSGPQFVTKLNKHHSKYATDHVQLISIEDIFNLYMKKIIK